MSAKPNDAANRTGVVTGAASGIGLATARRLHADGWSVVAVDLDADRLRWVDMVEPHGERIVACVADVATEVGNAAMVDAAVERFGAVHGVALNAGVGSSGTVEAQSLADLDRVLAVNLRGVILGVRAAVPALRAARGAIVVTASVSGMFGDPGMSAYNASKGGALNFARAAALELGADGVRVNAVCPGPIGDTGMTVPLERHAPERYDEMRSHVALRRWGRPEEVAAAIAWLLSDDASYITGVALPVDGGVTASTGMIRPGFLDH
jgi:meso-butanediol dehydrogenase / (S,S)-butanediol dehydrogenase / diacetyl reductase